MGAKSCFEILVSVVGGTKTFLNSKLYTYLVDMVSSFSSLSWHHEGGFSDTNLQEVNRIQAEGEGQFELKLSTKV